jgi:hypothetical protein
MKAIQDEELVNKLAEELDLSPEEIKNIPDEI